jgi:hypothetical protein
VEESVMAEKKEKDNKELSISKETKKNSFSSTGD